MVEKIVNILTIDIGGISIKYTIIKDKKIIVDINNISLRQDTESGLSSREDAIKFVGEIYTKHKKDIDGIAISAPGAVLDDGYINGITGIQNFNHFNLIETLKERYSIDLPIKVINDASAAAYADYSTVKPKSSLVTIAVGTGVGGGIIINGKLIFGANGYAGELGMTSTFTHERKDLLYPISASESSGFYSLEKKYFELSNTKKTGKEIFELFDKKDTIAMQVVDRFYNGLAIMITNVLVTLDPNFVFIAGGLSRRKESPAELRKYINVIIKNIGIKERFAEIRNSSFSNNAQLWGAYFYYINSLEQQQ